MKDGSADAVYDRRAVASDACCCSVEAASAPEGSPMTGFVRASVDDGVVE